MRRGGATYRYGLIRSRIGEVSSRYGFILPSTVAVKRRAMRFRMGLAMSCWVLSCVGMAWLGEVPSGYSTVQFIHVLV